MTTETVGAVVKKILTPRATLGSRAWPLPEQSWPEGTNEFQTFDTSFHPDCLGALAAVWDWTEGTFHGERRGLVLWGKNFGSGKTHLARAADAALVRWGRVGNFYSVPMWFGKIRSAYDKGWPETELFEEWVARPYFVLDDLGKQYSTASGGEWAREKLFILLDGLYAKGRSLLVTCNLDDPDELTRMLGGASWSRLFGLCDKEGFVDMSGIPDYRIGAL